ncbi:Intraflagellar transport protein 80 [Trebouxia sp. C0010 RCD-2024]
MKLKVLPSAGSEHATLANAVDWTGGSLATGGDDQHVQRWTSAGQASGQVCSLDSYCTDLHWCPGGSQSGALAVACTDGSFSLFSTSGRRDKQVKAHKGAVTSLRWNLEGTAILTSGEDGQVKVWSGAGMLRSTIAASASPVYSAAWGPDSNAVLYCSGKDLNIIPLHNSKKLGWQAHDSLILKTDWSSVNDLIISGAEDCRYKVWDTLGRLLYQSAPLLSTVTALAWSPTAEVFTVGTYNSLLLCHASGWLYSKACTNTGSISDLAWTADGTQLAGAGANGHICFAQVIGLTAEVGHIRATLTDKNSIEVYHLLDETVDELDFRDRVIKMCLGHGHLIVATATQCCIHSLAHLNTPHILDWKETPTLILHAERCFLLVTSSQGMQVVTYEGHQVCTINFPGMRPELLNERLLSLSNDTLAVVDLAAKGQVVRFFDTAQGRPLGQTVSHPNVIVSVALNQQGIAPDRQVVFIDQSRDMWIRAVAGKAPAVKLASMVDCALWHDSVGMLAFVADHKLVVQYYPNMVYADPELVEVTSFTRGDGELGKGALLSSFTGSQCVLRRGDGAEVVARVPPYPLVLHRLLAEYQWDKAAKLCHAVKDTSLWAVLAGWAVSAGEVDTAEVAFAGCEEVDKLQYMLYIKQLPSREARLAELALYRHNAPEAEAILLQANLLYRAIMLNVRTFGWARALQLAQKHNTHVPTVLLERSRYLARTGKVETDKQFLQCIMEVTVDEAEIEQQVQQEIANEAARPSAVK